MPALTEDVSNIINRFLCAKAEALGVAVIGLNGTEDHVHMIASVPPSTAVADFVGKIKGASSAKFNKGGYSDLPFYWQNEYGAFSFDRKRLPSYLAYVQRQKEHHRDRTTIPVLERTQGVVVPAVRERPVVYAAESELWRQEMLSLDDDGLPDFS
jgi:REP element-mobilizing transposase RayT